MPPIIGSRRNAGQINDVPITKTAPSDNQILKYNATTGMFEFAQNTDNDILVLDAGSASIPSGGCLPGQLSSELSNGFPISWARYQAGASRGTERICWTTPVKSTWDGGNFTAQIEAMIFADESADSIYEIWAVRVPHASSYDTPLELVATITVSYVTAYVKYLSAITSNFTVSGTGNTILWEIRRGSAAGDTLTGSAYFVNCEIVYGTDARTPSSPSASRPLTLSPRSALVTETGSPEIVQTGVNDVPALSNGFPLVYAVFKAGAYREVETLYWETDLDEKWDESYITAMIKGMNSVTEGTSSIYSLYAVRIPTAGDHDVTIPLVATITLSYTTGMRNYSSATTAPFLITGTGNTVLWKMVRSTAAGDTATGDVYFKICKVLYEVA